MYAHVMRKWSLIKLLMLLFLPIMILLFYCQGGVNAMYLSTPRQQIQQRLLYNSYITPKQNTQHLEGVEEKRYYNNENSNRFLSESNNNNNNNIYSNRKVDNHDSTNGDKMDDDSSEEEKKKNLPIKSDRNLIRSDNNLSNSNSYVNEYNRHEIQNSLWIKRMQEKRKRHENFRHMSSRIAASLSPSQPLSSSIINQTEYENLNPISTHSNSRQVSNNLNINNSSYRNRRDSSSPSNTNTNSNNNKNNNKNSRKLKKSRNRRRFQIKKQRNLYCPANDPDTLAFMAPIVFSGKIHSMSSNRSSNFYVTFEIQKIIKKTKGFTLPTLVRLQFRKSNKTECDIFKEEFRTVANVTQDFEQRKIYYLFLNQTSLQTFTILGQPIEVSRNVTNAIRKGIAKTYGQNATIEDLRYEEANINSTREQLINVNSRIRLVCKFKGRPAPKVTWYFKKEKIRGKHGFRVKTKKWKSVLTKRHAKVEDAGDYECRVRNILSKTTSRTIKIKVNQTKGVDISGQSSCDLPQDYCHNGGTCILFKQLSEYSCQCHESYSGQRCEHKVPSNSTFSNNNYDDDRLMPMTQMETSIPNDYYAEDVE